MNSYNRKKKKATPSNEVLVERDLSYLRERPESVQAKRVKSILELLVQIEDHRSTVGFLIPFRALASRLKSYKWVRKASVNSSGLMAHYCPANESLSEEDVWEYHAVRGLLDLAQTEEGLSRIRRCPECAQWFFALRRTDKKYCNNVCKQRNHDKDEDKRARKLATMRANYATEKGRALRAKQKVGLPDKKAKNSSAPETRTRRIPPR
jgi:hypothetical protein